MPNTKNVVLYFAASFFLHSILDLFPPYGAHARSDGILCVVSSSDSVECEYSKEIYTELTCRAETVGIQLCGSARISYKTLFFTPQHQTNEAIARTQYETRNFRNFGVYVASICWPSHFL